MPFIGLSREFASNKNIEELVGNTCLTSSKRRLSDPNGRGHRFNARRNDNLSLDFLFSHSKKVSDANVAIVSNFG